MQIVTLSKLMKTNLASSHKQPTHIRWWILLIFVMSSKIGWAQKSMEAVFLLPDSATTLSIDEFYRIVLEYHPIVKQAGLLNQMAQQEVRLARGGFDPKLNLSLDRKDFQDKTYYDRLDGYVSFPTWFPVNPKVGIERNRGSFLNASETIPGEQQV